MKNETIENQQIKAVILLLKSTLGNMPSSKADEIVVAVIKLLEILVD